MASTSKLKSAVCLALPGWCPCCPSDDESNAPPGSDKESDAPPGGDKNDAPPGDDKECEAAPIPKRKRLSLKKKPKATERYDFAVSEDDVERHRKGYCPKNTKINTDWAVRSFHQWREARHSSKPTDSCPPNILLSDDVSELDRWLYRYLTETRKTDGSEYPPRTLYLLLTGVQRYILAEKQNKVSLFHDGGFRGLQNLCNSLFNELHAKGIGSDAKKTQVLTSHDEAKLWEAGVLDTNTPQGLLNCVFFYNGNNFYLRGGQEHRDLKLSQLCRQVVSIEGEARVCYTYTEHGSKNRQKSLKQLRLDNKVVHQYETPDSGERCHVSILDKYMSKIPPGAFTADVFYLRPLSKPPGPSKLWYSLQPLGRNTFTSIC